MLNISESSGSICLQWFTHNHCAVIHTIATVLNSNFSTALLGSLAGAFAGAIAAQRIVENTRTRDELVKELRNTNAASMASFVTCNAVLALKKQHIHSLTEQFKSDRAAVQALHAQYQTGKEQGTKPFHFTSNFNSFSAPFVPVEPLKDLLFNKLSLTGRPLALGIAIEDAAGNLAQSLAARQALIDQFKKKVIPTELLPQYYFGLPLKDGSVHLEYPDSIDAISSYVDDLIFFSYLLCCDLNLHANDLYASIPKRQRKMAPKPVGIDFSDALNSRRIPSTEQYIDWLKGFQKDALDPKAI